MRGTLRTLTLTSAVAIGGLLAAGSTPAQAQVFGPGGGFNLAIGVGNPYPGFYGGFGPGHGYVREDVRIQPYPYPIRDRHCGPWRPPRYGYGYGYGYGPSRYSYYSRTEYGYGPPIPRPFPY